MSAPSRGDHFKVGRCSGVIEDKVRQITATVSLVRLFQHPGRSLSAKAARRRNNQFDNIPRKRSAGHEPITKIRSSAPAPAGRCGDQMGESGQDDADGAAAPVRTTRSGGRAGAPERSAARPVAISRAFRKFGRSIASPRQKMMPSYSSGLERSRDNTTTRTSRNGPRSG